ncbi:hypothetical protein FB45DRAFT_125807 [Roridomyces roridus]|uniref:Uncharacterized protein n=1 Tax=Roridomyces roridus TaxID=1738132 RepID=A0AAD7BJ20_9AGAR|nr:hypothetical protein FB45DRAFT_125807 [Roridomyces roridus]
MAASLATCVKLACGRLDVRTTPIWIAQQGPFSRGCGELDDFRWRCLILWRSKPVCIRSISIGKGTTNKISASERHPDYLEAGGSHDSPVFNFWSLLPSPGLMAAPLDFAGGSARTVDRWQVTPPDPMAEQGRSRCHTVSSFRRLHNQHISPSSPIMDRRSSRSCKISKLAPPSAHHCFFDFPSIPSHLWIVIHQSWELHQRAPDRAQV